MTMTMTRTLLRRDDATLLADSGLDVLSDVCPVCQGDTLLAGLSCPKCGGDGAVYWVASYSARLAEIVAEVTR